MVTVLTMADGDKSRSSEGFLQLKYKTLQKDVDNKINNTNNIGKANVHHEDTKYQQLDGRYLSNHSSFKSSIEDTVNKMN